MNYRNEYIITVRSKRLRKTLHTFFVENSYRAKKLVRKYTTDDTEVDIAERTVVLGTKEVSNLIDKQKVI